MQRTSLEAPPVAATNVASAHTHTQRGSNFTSVRLRRQLSVISGVKGRCIGRGKLQAHHRCNTAQPLDQVIPAKPNLEGRIRRVIQFLFFIF